MKSWAWRVPRPRRSSRRRSASSPCSTIPIAIRATRSASTASRSSTRPTTSSRMATSAPPMTASAMRPSSMEGPAVTASAPTLPPPSPTFSTICSAWVAGAAAARHASAEPTCATTWRSASKRRSPARPRRFASRPPSAAKLVPAAAPRPAQGRGQVIEDPCPNCSGSGRVTRERTLSVNIPAGVEDGTRIRLAGEGEAGVRGGPAGDLYIFLSLKPHPFFQRDGADLFCRVPISMVTAALGGEFGVPTLGGSEALVKVPEATQSGKQFRLRGKGMPVLRSRDLGDLYIQVVVETPQKLTKRQRELLMEFDAECSKENHPESSGFFSRVREFFDGLGGAS